MYTGLPFIIWSVYWPIIGHLHCMSSIFIGTIKSFIFRYNVMFTMVTYITPMLGMGACYVQIGRNLWGGEVIGNLFGSRANLNCICSFVQKSFLSMKSSALA